MLPLVRAALASFASGHSPYAMYHMPWQVPLTYLPATWLPYLAPYLLGLDIRVSSLLAELAVGAIVWRRFRRGADPRAPIVWAVIFLRPGMVWWALSTTATIWCAWLAWVLDAIDRARDKESATALGVCGASSPLAAVVAPFAIVRVVRDRGVTAALTVALVAGAIAAALIVPFYLWAPQDFLLGTVRWFNDNQGFPLDRFRLGTWAHEPGLSGLFWSHGLVGWLKWIQAGSLVALALGFARRGSERHALPAFAAAAYLVFGVFNPVLWSYLYHPASIASLFALVTSGG
jgi:hypothetical protein